MVVRVASRTVYDTPVTPGGLDVETNLIDIAAQGEIYNIEGYVDLVNLAADDILVIREYLSGDGTNLRLFFERTFNNARTLKALRFHSKTMQGPYRVTIEQTDGVVREILPWFVRLQMEVV